MVVEINAIVQSVRTLSDLLKAHKSLANYNELITAVSEVNAQLITAQAAALNSQKSEMALSLRVSTLEKEIGELKNWKREEERHVLCEIAPGIPARVLKPGMERGDTPVPLCANCFGEHKKMFLQSGPGTHQWKCARCKGEWFPVRSGGSRRIVRA